MAEKARYPQIPSTVWWGVRDILHRTPNTTLDERALSVQLSVQSTAARAYIGELKAAGLLDDEGKSTALAQKWRLDPSYPEAVQELLSNLYPQQLLDIAPPEEANRPMILDWFMREGLGRGAAGNKTATYLLIGSPIPNEAPIRGNAKKPTERKQNSIAGNRNKSRVADERVDRRSGDAPPLSGRKQAPEHMPLNVNLQIHISADAGSEQIEAIFRAMKHYLYDPENS